MNTYEMLLKLREEVLDGAKYENLDFDMSTWLEVDEDKEDQLIKLDDGTFLAPIRCATAVCALGTACLVPEFKERGLALQWEGAGLIPVFEGEIMFEAGAKFFGISNDESLYLFDPGEYERDYEITREEVAEHIDEVAARYASASLPERLRPSIPVGVG